MPVKYSQLKSYVYLIIGFILLFIGSRYFIIGSQQIAVDLKISETIIGLTLVALGTSLPELATGITAALKRQSSLAVGTILGSNIYNIAAIFAIIVFFKPVSLLLDEAEQNLILFSALFMSLVTLMFVLKIRYGFKLLGLKANQLGVRSGILFLSIYVIYTIYNYY